MNMHHCMHTDNNEQTKKKSVQKNFFVLHAMVESHRRVAGSVVVRDVGESLVEGLWGVLEHERERGVRGVVSVAERLRLRRRGAVVLVVPRQTPCLSENGSEVVRRLLLLELRALREALQQSGQTVDVRHFLHQVARCAARRELIAVQQRIDVAGGLRNALCGETEEPLCNVLMAQLNTHSFKFLFCKINN